MALSRNIADSSGCAIATIYRNNDGARGTAAILEDERQDAVRMLLARVPVHRVKDVVLQLAPMWTSAARLPPLHVLARSSKERQPHLFTRYAPPFICRYGGILNFTGSRYCR
ncbi:Uu.00g078880.m01.CDS01 [Anthostomella pinea]|uniref:Uu.00g078880.m01.CDS01 n=1 Tax=Anthostomella pinea TaxID=933095 RepID=A0AAI8VLD4_9PEZI|nr:Uu.00g078880.m01.CDS01 [Anthostomella pinea]